MEFIKVRTRKFLAPKDDFYELLDAYLPPLKNGDVLLITSKILGIHQGRCVPIDKKIKNQKDILTMQEADRYLPIAREKIYGFRLTIKDHTIIASAGIDKSNSNGYFVLWPKNTNALLKEIVTYLKKKHKLRDLAAIATDSHVTPLRTGVNGISTGFFGLEPIIDRRGSPDIFGHKLKVTRVNVIDALAAIGVYLMGEGNERTPMVIARKFPNIKFTNKNTYRKLVIKPEMDIYWPLLRLFKKIKKR